MKTSLLAIVIATACVGSVNAQKVIGAEIVEFGIFKKIATRGYLLAPQSAEGKVHAVMEAELIQSTTEIRASVGTSFGIRFKLIGTPNDEMVKCSFRWHHPKITDPATEQTSDSDQWDGEPRIGHSGYNGYTFDNDWEIVPGKWTIQVLYAGKVIAEKTFDVIRKPSV